MKNYYGKIIMENLRRKNCQKFISVYSSLLCKFYKIIL